MFHFSWVKVSIKILHYAEIQHWLSHMEITVSNTDHLEIAITLHIVLTQIFFECTEYNVITETFTHVESLQWNW